VSKGWASMKKPRRGKQSCHRQRGKVGHSGPYPALKRVIIDLLVSESLDFRPESRRDPDSKAQWVTMVNGFTPGTEITKVGTRDVSPATSRDEPRLQIGACHDDRSCTDIGRACGSNIL